MRFENKEIDNAVVTYPDMANHIRGGISFDSPISVRENMRLNYQGKAMWMPLTADKNWFCPHIIPDNPARAFVIQGAQYDGPVGGDDMFGIYWEYVPSARGSIVRPGNPTLTDVTQWREVIKFPDVDSWDWEGSAKANKEFLANNPRYTNFCIFTGWFERLISWMDFGPAAFALMNRKTKDTVKEIMDALSDLWIDIIDHVDKYYGHDIDGFCIHDDWGAQDGPFFNPRVVNEMLVPYMRRVTDHMHELGYTADLHSCGKIEKLIPSIIDAGWDAWDGMVINDYSAIFAEYGDKLIMQIPLFDMPADADPETQKEFADKFAEEFCIPGKPGCFAGLANGFGATIFDFQKELYKQSRIKFSDED